MLTCDYNTHIFTFSSLSRLSVHKTFVTLSKSFVGLYIFVFQYLIEYTYVKNNLWPDLMMPWIRGYRNVSGGAIFYSATGQFNFDAIPGGPVNL